MRALIRIGMLGILLACGLAVFLIVGPAKPPAPGASSTRAAAVDPIDEGLPPGRPVTVSLHPGEGLRAQLTQYGFQSERVLTDQYLDWLVFTAVSAIRPSARASSEILYDLPTIRAGYMRGTGYFEFGRTRTRALGNGIVLALVPATVSANQRKDDLAHIADEQRKNEGKPFDHLVVVEYTLNADEGSAVLLRQPDVAYATLFSSEYGYHEAVILSEADLRRFLGSVDDLTRATRTSVALTVGGRKILARHYRGVGVEHVATLWKAEKALLDREKAIDQRLEEFRDSLNAKLRRHEIALSEGERRYEEFQNQLYRDYVKSGGISHTGFSLDPTYDYEELKKNLEEKSEFIKDVLEVPEGDIKAAIKGISSKDIVPFLKMSRKVEEQGRIGSHYLDRMKSKFTYQIARYDGDLKGTEVGMILFYTDLLAKMWAINFEEAGPHAAVDGFVDLVHAISPAIYKDEARRLSHARLWFGTNDAGFQVASQGEEVLFARRATRIYSAGSDPVDPGHEVQTSAKLAAPIDWWNDHYEEVAGYEQEYQRLDQVMKWSMVVGWLNEAERGALLAGLQYVAVNRNLRLPDWVKTQSDLKFTKWDEVKFLPAGYLGNPTEAMPILFASNGAFSGGVSLAEKKLFTNRLSVGKVETLARNSTVNYGASSGERLVTFDKTVFRRVQGNDLRAAMVVEPQAGLKLRSSVSQIANGHLERAAVRAEEGGVRFTTRVDDVPLGDLEIRNSPNGFEVGWAARDLDAANSLAIDVSIAREPLGEILRNPRVTAAIELGDSRFAVRMRGQDKWVVLESERTNLAEMGKGLRARAAHPLSDHGVQTRIIDDDALMAELGGDRGMLVLDHHGGQPYFRQGSGAPPSGGGGGKFTLGDGGELPVWKGSDEFPTLMVADFRRHKDPGRLVEALSRQEGAAFAKAAKGETVALPGLSGRSRQAMHDLESGRFHETAFYAADNPGEFQRLLHEKVLRDAKAADNLARDGHIEDALTLLNDNISKLGPDPDLLLRRDLLLLVKDKPGLAVGNGNTPLPHLRDSESLYREIAARQRAADGRQAENLGVFDSYVRASEQHAQAPGLGRPVLDQDGLRIRLGLVIDNPPMEPLKKVSPLRDGTQVYVADSPALSNLNWQENLTSTLNTLVARDDLVVIQLPVGGIDRFGPTTVHLVREKRSIPLRSVRVPSEPSTDSRCSNDNNSSGCGNDVYLVIPKAASI